MIFDGGSLDIFLHDLTAAYEGARIEAETFTSFDLALLEREKAQGSAWAEDMAFFHHRLGDGEGATVFPTDKRVMVPARPERCMPRSPKAAWSKPLRAGA